MELCPLLGVCSLSYANAVTAHIPADTWKMTSWFQHFWASSVPTNWNLSWTGYRTAPEPSPWPGWHLLLAALSRDGRSQPPVSRKHGSFQADWGPKFSFSWLPSLFFFFFSPFWRWSLQTFDLKSNISTSSVPFLPKEYGNNVGHQNYGTVGLNIPNIKNKSCSLDLKPIYCIDMGYYFKVIFTVVCDWMYLPVLRPGRNIEYCAIRNTILRADNLYLAVAVCLYLNLEINFSCTLDLFGFIHHKLMNDW